MRAIAILGFIAALLAPAMAQAPQFEDPQGPVEFLYAPYLAGEVGDYPLELFSPTLRELWDDMERRSEEAEMFLLGFDPFINGQDFDLSGFAVADPLVEGDTATVVATFDNFGAGQEMRFTLVRRAEGWKIDDLEQVAGDITYRLSELLAADPLLN